MDEGVWSISGIMLRRKDRIPAEQKVCAALSTTNPTRHMSVLSRKSNERICLLDNFCKDFLQWIAQHLDKR